MRHHPVEFSISSFLVTVSEVANWDLVDNERKKHGKLPRRSRKKRGNDATHIEEEAGARLART
jgi:hypothetical protein